jgi:hypothetical protein
VEPQHGGDGRAVDRVCGPCQALGDPVRLGGPLELVEVGLAALAVHRHDRDEAAAGDEADEQQPPLELRHQGGRIGRTAAPGGIRRRRAYTRPR